MDDEKLLTRAYADLLSPAAQEVGTTLSAAVRVALSPVNLLVWTFEQAAQYAEEHVRAIFEVRKVPADRISTPKIEIAVPVINALRVPGKDDTLRRLYLNLLATAMDLGRSDAVHPAFVEIVKSLTPQEARCVTAFTWLNSIGAPACFPLIDVIATLNSAGEVQVLSRVTNIGSLAGCGDLPSSSIDNLVRLGLCAVHVDRRMRDDKEYEPLLSDPAVAQMREIAESRPGSRVKFRYGVLEVTQFGFDFAHACTGGIECIGLNPIMPCETRHIVRKKPLCKTRRNGGA